MPQTVTLVLYDPAHAADLDYRLHGEQAQYSVSPQERLQNGRFAAPDCLAVTILCQNRPIGFFILDKGSDRLTYSANRAAIGLYQSCGFADTGRTFMGTKGLQYIYSKTIR